VYWVCLVCYIVFINDSCAVFNLALRPPIGQVAIVPTVSVSALAAIQSSAREYFSDRCPRLGKVHAYFRHGGAIKTNRFSGVRNKRTSKGTIPRTLVKKLSNPYHSDSNCCVSGLGVRVTSCYM
jgi:hypothetical protein